MTAECDRIASVSVKVPVPHLEGEYSYLVPKDMTLHIGSLVRIPFGSHATNGYVTEIESISNPAFGPELRPITSVVGKDYWFDENSLLRYRQISSLYGASLHSVLTLAIPAKSLNKIRTQNPVEMRHEVTAHQEFLTKRFGSSWSKDSSPVLLLAPGTLWQRVIASLILAKRTRTLVLLPTENLLKRLSTLLKEAGITRAITLSSATPASERASAHQMILAGGIDLVIGTRSAALAPFAPERVIILDQGDVNFRERRHPYFRADDLSLWEGCQQIVRVLHAPTLEILATKEKLIYEKTTVSISKNFRPCQKERITSELSKEISAKRAKAILITVSDKSFASALLCTSCKNRLRCDCGFPLTLAARGSEPRCNRCSKSYLKSLCRHCGAQDFLSFAGGTERWALSLASNIRGAKVIISTADNLKDEVELEEKSPTIVIATPGSEPLLTGKNHLSRGYDVIVLLGGNALFNSASLTFQEQARVRWGRSLGLLRTSMAPTDPERISPSILVEIEPSHSEFRALRDRDYARTLQPMIDERKALMLPPFAILCEIRGEERSLHRLRQKLSQDPLFAGQSSALYPVKDGSFLVKVPTKRRYELIHLLQGLVRLRSARKLSPLTYELEPHYL